MKYTPIWYDMDTVVSQDAPIEATCEEEARNKAYELHRGNPPAPMLYLKPEG